MPLVTGAEPIGSIITSSTAGVSTGFMLCDGSAISRTTYAALFLKIGTAFGSGDGSTTFNIPDLRGQFIRGTSYGSGLDPNASGRGTYLPGGNTGDQIGSYQGPAVGYHNHILYTYSGWGYNNGGNRAFWNAGDRSTGQAAGQYTDYGDSGIGSETRPYNVYVNFLIKAY